MTIRIATRCGKPLEIRYRVKRPHNQFTHEILSCWQTDLINEFFTTVGARTVETVKSLANENGISQMTFTSFDSFIGDEFVLRAVSMAEVRKIVFSFGSNKAPGPDKVPIKVIKDALLCILPTLTEIINSSRYYISFSVRLEGSRSDCIAERWGSRGSQ